MYEVVTIFVVGLSCFFFFLVTDESNTNYRQLIDSSFVYLTNETGDRQTVIHRQRDRQSEKIHCNNIK